MFENDPAQHHRVHLLKVRSEDVDNSGSGNGVIVGEGRVARGKDSVSLTAGTKVAAGNLARDGLGLGVDSRGLKDRPGDKGPGDEQRARRVLEVGRQGEGDVLLLAEETGALGSERGESLDGQSGVAARARLDEGRSKGVDLVEVEGDVVGRGEGAHALGVADEGVVARLDGQDGAGGGQVLWVGDLGCGAEVGGDTDALEDGSGGDKVLGRGDAEGVRAGGGGVVAGS